MRFNVARLTMNIFRAEEVENRPVDELMESVVDEMGLEDSDG
jgi:division protein CdvB (Snf7/Vps24/ESCRT-III family)